MQIHHYLSAITRGILEDTEELHPWMIVPNDEWKSDKGVDRL